MATTWDLFRSMDALRREFDRAFEESGYGWSRRPFSRFSFLPGRAARGYPLMNVSEDENSVHVAALAPGLNPDSLNIHIVENQLTISGEKPALSGDIRPEAYHRNERAAGKFVRTISLPSQVDQAKAKAEYTNGILTISLPKAEAARPRKIDVKVK